MTKTKVIKRRKANGSTYKIEKVIGEGGYYLRKDGDVFDSVSTKTEAKDFLEETIKADKKRDESESSGGGGLFNFGMGKEGDGSDDFGLLGENDSDTEEFDFL